MLQQYQINKLQKIQNKCVELIDSSRKHVNAKFSELRILKVSEIIELELAKIGFKLIKGILPKKILETISTDASLKNLDKKHHYQTRQKILQNLPRTKCKLYSASFLCKSISRIQPFVSLTNRTNNVQAFVHAYKNKLFATGHNC